LKFQLLHKLLVNEFSFWKKIWSCSSEVLFYCARSTYRKQSSKMPSGILPVVNTPPTTLRISSEVLGERERDGSELCKRLFLVNNIPG
jgi:hypothetical protein